MTGGLLDAFALAGVREHDLFACRRMYAYDSLDTQKAHAKKSTLRDMPEEDDDASFVLWSDEAMRRGARRLFVPTLDMSDEKLDALIEYALENEVRLAAVCSRTLTEAGRIDARFGKSPVMLLHSFGLLALTTVLSGVYLDKDDLSLMAQEGVSLTVFPSCDAGYGNGIAPITAAKERGVRLHIGTGEGRYNRTRNVLYEAALLRLSVSAQMNRQDAVSSETLATMCLPDGADDTCIASLARRFSDDGILP